MNKFSRFIVSGVFLCASSVFAQVELVSIAANGEQANNLSFGASISADGRFVAFSSAASNLVPADTNATSDIFVRDRDSGLTQRVNVSSTGEQAVNHGVSENPSISADGRFVVYSSYATNLVVGDTNGRRDIFVYDRESGMTQRVSLSSTGEQANNHAEHPSISADGRYVVFQSKASNLVAADAGFNQDVFMHDRETGNTLRASEFNDGLRYESSSPVVSANGRFVAFHSTVWLQGQRDVYIYDSVSGELESLIEQLSVLQNVPSLELSHASLNANGRIIGFRAFSRFPPFEFEQLLVHDRNTGVTNRVDISTEGIGADFGADYASLSADGRFVSFTSYATNLVEGDTNNSRDLFVHDSLLHKTERLAELTNYIYYTGTSFNAKISADGRFVTFHSNDAKFATNDTNDVVDVFVLSNTLVDGGNDQLSVEKLINNETRETLDNAAKLATGTLYRQSYKVTNDSPNRIYQVRIFENGNMVCNFYSLNPGQSRQRCDTYKIVLEGEQQMQVNVSAKVSGSDESLSSSTVAYYTGLNVNGELRVTHRIDNVNADSLNQAHILDSSQASVSYKVENTGEVELYQVKTYHDPVSPVNSGWLVQCVLGPIKPGQVRYCKRDIDFTDAGLNQAIGRAQGRNAIRSATDIVNASNPTYFIVP